MLTWTLFVVASFLVFEPSLGSHVSSKQDVIEKDGTIASVVEEVHLDGRAVLKRLNSGSASESFFAKIELPTLEGGKTYRANITVVNPYSEPIPFSIVSMSGIGGKFTGDFQEIPALGEVKCVIQFDVSASLHRAAAQSVLFHSAEDPSKVALTLRYSYEVNNVFAFLQRRVEMEIPENEKNVNLRVPFHFVEPITMEQLELSWSENLNGVNFRIEGDGENSELPFVMVEAVPSLIPRSGVVGELRLRNVDTGVKSQVEIRIFHHEPLTLRPESLRLTRGRQANSYSAIAMLRIPALQVKGDERAEEPEAQEIVSVPQVELAIGGEEANVALRPLGNSGIYRVTVHFHKQFDESPPERLGLRWKITFNGVERVINSHAFLPSSIENSTDRKSESGEGTTREGE